MSGWQTKQAVRGLATEVLYSCATRDGAQELTEWAMETIEKLAGWHSHGVCGVRWLRLRRGLEVDLFARIGPWLGRALERDNAAPLLAVARGLERRGWALPELQELLHRATEHKDLSVARSAMELWLADHRHRGVRAARLLERDESVVTVGPVFRVVLQGRPDLVDQLVLSGRPLRGRFGSTYRNTVWIPDIPNGVLLRWAPAQVNRYAQLLAFGAQDSGMSRSQRAYLVRRLASLPDSGVDHAQQWINSEDVLLAEAALTGLGACDRPDLALPLLLEVLDTDRARVAVYSASRCTTQLPASLLEPLLRRVLLETRKITPRKEATRLLVRTRTPGTVEVLLEALRSADQHRDVAAAIVAGLTRLLDDERVWPVLDRVASEHDRASVDSLLALRPGDLPERYRQRFAALVLRAADHPDQQTARKALEVLPGWSFWAKPGACAAALVRAVTSKEPGPTWRTALNASLHPVVLATNRDLLAKLVKPLLAASLREPEAEPTRDRPAWRRLAALVDQLCRSGPAVRRDPEPVLQVVEMLAGTPDQRPAAARLLAVLTRPGSELTQRIARIAQLLSDHPIVAARIVVDLEPGTWPAEKIEEGLKVLRKLKPRREADGDLATSAGLMSVDLVAAGGSATGWAPKWRDLLKALRRNPSPQVRWAALEVSTVELD